MTKKRDDIELDEKEILDDLEKDAFVLSESSDKKVAMAELAAKNFMK